MKTQKTKNETEYAFYFDRWEETNDPSWAVKIAEMIKAKKIQMKAIQLFDSPGFKPASMIKKKCCKCSKYYLAGEPCFYRGKDGWHEACASDEDKKLPYYLACKEKELKKNKPAYQIKSEMNNEQDIAKGNHTTETEFEDGALSL